jgi:hypothetical protein
MSKRFEKPTTEDRSRFSNFEPNALAGSHGEQNAAEQELIEMHVSRRFYEKAKTANKAKSFSGKQITPKRFLEWVEILVRSYVRNREMEAHYKRKAARIQLQKLAKALSLSAEVREYLKEVFIAEQIRDWIPIGTRRADEMSARFSDLEVAFDGFALAVGVAVQRIPNRGKTPDHSAKRLVTELAFAWYYLIGEPSTHSRSDKKVNSPFRELLRLINDHLIPEEYRSKNDFESYGAEAVKSAKYRFRLKALRPRVKKRIT